MAKDETASVELVKADDLDTLGQMFAGMIEAADPTAEEQQEIAYRIFMEMATAETEADLWKEATTWSSKDAIGRAFEIRNVRAYRSKFKDSRTGRQGGFLSLEAVDLETGEQGILNTSAGRLAGRVAWYWRNGRLPIRLRVIKRGETADGYPILDAELV